MDSEVLIATLGIIGTLLGALGGAALSAWATLRQVRSQAVAEHSHWLREQRQRVYTDLLVVCERLIAAVQAPMEARLDGTYSSLDWNAMWAPADEMWREARRAVLNIALAGPTSMQECSEELLWKAAAVMDSVRSPSADVPDQFLILANRKDAQSAFEMQQRIFVTKAQESLEADAPALLRAPKGRRD